MHTISETAQIVTCLATLLCCCLCKKTGKKIKQKGGFKTTLFKVDLCLFRLYFKCCGQNSRTQIRRADNCEVSTEQAKESVCGQPLTMILFHVNVLNVHLNDIEITFIT